MKESFLSWNVEAMVEEIPVISKLWQPNRKAQVGAQPKAETTAFLAPRVSLRERFCLFLSFFIADWGRK